MSRTPSWFRIENKASDPTVADIHILDAIARTDFWGDGAVTTAKGFIAELNALPAAVKTIRLHVNSPGGDVFPALAIANALREQRTKHGRTVEGNVLGVAASAATLPLMACDPIRMADNSLLMIHNPISGLMGDAKAMRKRADMLDQLGDSVVATYQWKTTKPAAEVSALMDAETWMDPADAIANGFADEVVQGLRAVASLDALASLNVPERFAALVTSMAASFDVADERDTTNEGGGAPDGAVEGAAPAAVVAAAEAITSEPVDVDGVTCSDTASAILEAVPPVVMIDAAGVLAMCAEAGLPIDFAAQLVSSRTSLADARQLVSAERERIAAENRRQEDIRALCARFRVDALAPELIGGGMPFDRAKALVAKVKAIRDVGEIDGGLSPDAGTGRKPAIDTAAIYARLNNPGR